MSIITKYLQLAVGQYRQIAASSFTKKFFGVFALDVLAKGSMFLFLPLFLRLMSKEEFGAFSYLLFIIMNMGYFIKVGMDTAQAKLFFDFTGDKKKVMLFNVNAFLLVLFVVIVGVLVWSQLDVWLFERIGVDQQLFGASRLFIYAYVFAFIQQIMLQSYFIADNKPALFQVYNLVKVMAMSLGSLAVLHFFKEAKIENRLMVEAFASILVFIPLTLFYIRQMKATVDPIMLQKALRIGLPMLGSVFVGFVYSFVDKYYLQRSFGYADVAIYSLAIFLTTPVNLIFSSFNLIWYSKFFNEKNEHVNYKHTKKVYAVMLLFFAILFLLVWAAVYACIKLGIIEPGYMPVCYVLPFVFFYRVLESLSNLYSNFLVQSERTYLIFMITMMISGMAWLSFSIAIPRFGYVGAAIILLCMELIRTAFLIFFARKQVIRSGNKGAQITKQEVQVEE